VRSATWLERYQQRYEWAVNTYNDFISELAPELVNGLQRREQVTIAVYGATQVGKTTLILDLLGLNASTEEQVAHVLRGGQALGKSATAVLIRYRRSQDDSWYILGVKQRSSEDACEYLATVRRQVESGVVGDAEVLDIMIPRCLFPKSETTDDVLEINIIDIPGINSLNASERELVAELTHRYVTVADIVLLVGRADNLGFLNEQDLMVEALAEWSSQPTRFRIVLTFSFSPDSLFRQFQHQELTIDHVRDVLIREMDTHDYNFPPEFRSNLFVLEIGDSISALQRTNSEYCLRIINVTQDFREDLLSNLKQASSPYARLQGVFQLDRVIKARMDRLEQTHNDEHADLSDRQNEIMRELELLYPDLIDGSKDDVSYKLSDVEEELNETFKKCDHLQGCLVKVEEHDFRSFFRVRLASKKINTVMFLKKQMERCEEEQRKKCIEAGGSLVKEGLIPKCVSKDFRPITYSRHHLLSMAATLDGYWTDSYILSSSFNVDYFRLDTAFGETADELGITLKSTVIKVLKSRMKQLKSKSDRLADSNEILRWSLDKLLDVENERDEISTQYAENFKRLGTSLRLVDSFEDKINDAFSVELEKVRSESRNHPIAEQRFLSLLNQQLLLSEVDRMHEGMGYGGSRSRS